MNPFQYATATTPDEAISLVGKNGRYLGGGIDLLDEMKAYILSPDVLVDVKSVNPLLGGKANPIVFVGHTGVPGSSVCNLESSVTIAQMASDANLQKYYPGLVEAASEVGSPQIRNVATLAGNLLQHSRCWYYRQPDIVCLKRGGNTCFAQEGENKYSSLFSGCACISPVVSNLAVILTALDAWINIRSKGKDQKISVDMLYHSAWHEPFAHNSLKAETFLTGVSLHTQRNRSAYRQISEKSSFDWALVSCAAAGNVANGKITDARVVLGAVAPVPYMVKEANDFLEGKPLTDETASKAADIILKDAKPLAQNGYKVPLAHTLIRRTLLALNS